MITDNVFVTKIYNIKLHYNIYTLSLCLLYFVHFVSIYTL